MCRHSAGLGSIFPGSKPDWQLRCDIKKMKFARVIGTLVATTKYEGLEGIKFLVVQPLTKKHEPTGEPVIAADGTAQAGPSDLVFIVGSREAAQGLPEPFVPVDHAIVGIVDDTELVEDKEDPGGSAWKWVVD